MNQETKTCQNCKSQFTIEPDDFAFYEKINVPAPTRCSDCRLQRRLSWRNMRSIYRRKCDLCKQDKISIYSPDKPFTVYCSKCWWSDSWDPLEYGREYDLEKSFFEQFAELLKDTPLVGRFGYEDTAVRSDYVNMFKDVKDCYLCFHVDFCERCLYVYHSEHSTDCVSIAFSYGNELCYESMALQKCNRVFFSAYSESCLDSWFLKNCSGCSHCFASANLRNKQYYIFNEPCGSKEAYISKLKKLGFDNSSYLLVQNFRERAYEHWKKYPSKYMHGLKNLNATGEFVNNSKNTFNAFSVRDCENVKNAMFLIVGGGKDSMDWTQYGDNGELMYEVVASGGGAYKNYFGTAFWKGCKNCEYGWFTLNCSNTFGSVSLKNKQYCILNKQYSKEEYEKLRAQIIERMKADGEYGEFFPIRMSPFGYNETTAQEDFPLTEQQASELGFKWTDIEKNKGKYNPTMHAGELPDKVTDVEKSILKEIISCEKCDKVYKIVPAELNFHRSLSLPLPRVCVDCRYDELRAMRNKFRLFHGKCHCAGKHSDDRKYSNMAESHKPHELDSHCPNKFETTYPPDKKEIVYCEQCYQAEVA